MLNILILEDDHEHRIPSFKKELRHNLKIVDTAQDAISAMKAERFDVIFLDHDLGGQTYVDPQESNTGSEVVRWMITDYDTEKHMPSIIVHSMNTIAAVNMVNNLRTKFGSVYHISFDKLLTQFLCDPSFLT